MILYILLFCYVFAFYFFGVSVSILISIPLYLYSIINYKYNINIKFVFNSKFFKNILIVWYILIFLSILFPLIYVTYDFSFFKIILTQLIHLLAAVPVLAFLKYKNITVSDVENIFINIFIIQSIIQIIVLNSDYLSQVILTFNRFEPEKVIGIGSKVRGKALSAATTYHLSLAYGIAFLILVKKYVKKKVSFLIILKSLLLLTGIFFCGRTGFVGVVIALISIPIVNRGFSFKSVFKFLVSLFIILLFIDYFLNSYFYDFYRFLHNVVFPYAFESFYALQTSGEFETKSTNRLLEMWSENNFNFYEFVFGSGKYTNPNGSYYMKVDSGFLRHPLFFGVVGYLFLLIYQFTILPIFKFKGRDKLFSLFILFYLFVMDFKAVTIGINKFVFSISLLLSFSYLYLNIKQEKK